MKPSLPLLLALPCSLALPIQDPAEPSPDDATLLAAWEKVARSKRKRSGLVDAFTERVDALDTEQLRLVRALGEAAGKPRKAPDPPFFEPKEHVRNQPVRRKALKDDDERYVGMRKALERLRDERALRTAHRYDWCERAVVRVGDPEDPDLVFHNALHGHPPGLELARAQALAILDGGHHETLLCAFDHAYTDRDGGLYPGITLYDMWLSGITLEMPDVDTLGLVHTILDDWETWKDPVPDEQKEGLYGRLAELFGRARNYREPRESAVDNLLVADPVPRKGYDSLHGNFQALWAAHGSDAASLGAEFPDAEGWRPWIEAWVERCKTDAGVWDKGVERQAALAESARLVRQALVEAMREEGLLE